MSNHTLLPDLLTIFVVSITVVFLFHQFRLPSIAGFLCAGAMIGPHGLNLVSDQDQVKVLAEIGVVLLLFTIGIEFSLAHLTSVRRLMLVGGTFQVGGVLLFATVVGYLLGLSLAESVFWGCVLSLSSTAIVLKLLTDRGDMDSIHGRATTSILVFQDLAVVPMMLIVPLLATPMEDAAKQVALTMGKALLAVGLTLVGAARLQATAAGWVGAGLIAAAAAGLGTSMALGLRALAPWARHLQIATAAIGLLACPFTLAAATVIFYMTRPDVRATFEGTTTVTDASDSAEPTFALSLVGLLLVGLALTAIALLVFS